MNGKKHWAVLVIALMAFSALGCLTVGSETPEPGMNAVPKCVMYEQFTNWHCGLCVPSEECYCPLVKDYYGYDNVAPLYYHYPSVTDDPAWLYNPLDNLARSIYYGVAFLPYMRIDGRWFPAQANETYFKDLIDERLALPANISITASGTLWMNNLTGRVVADFVAVEDVVQTDLIAHFALWENEIPVLERFNQSAPNGVDPWHWTMWDMMPDAYGTELWTGGTTAGAAVQLTHDFIIEPEWNISNLGISIWVQSNGTKVCEQAYVVDDWNVLWDFDVPIVDPGSLDWRFVSFPIDAEGQAIDIFDDLMWGDGNTTWDCMMLYDPTNVGNEWKTYSKFKPPALNDLPYLNNTMGVWIHLTSNGGDQVLTVGLGHEPNVTAVALRSGWNMVGYPARNDSAYTVAQLMTDTGATSVEGYDPLAAYRIEALPGSYVLKRGEAYWVKANADTVWIVDW
jgi:hypothetical protein